MNPGKTVFAQLMDFLPWSTFDGSVSDRAIGVSGVKRQYR